MAAVSVRYIVDDVDAAIAFYCDHLGFKQEMHPAASFAMLSRGDLRLVLSAPSGAGGGGQAMPDGTKPQPGDWNRFVLELPDLATAVDKLRKAEAHFRNDIITASAASRSCSRTPPATRSSYSSQRSPKPPSRHPNSGAGRAAPASPTRCRTCDIRSTP